MCTASSYLHILLDKDLKLKLYVGKINKFEKLGVSDIIVSNK
jgi:hypothetical protein